MRLEPGDRGAGPVSEGTLNRAVGWTMLIVGVGAAAALDPWLLTPQSSVVFSDSLRPAVRHAQGVVLGMALLQLAMSHLLATSAYERAARRIAALLTTLGAALYATGYSVGLVRPELHWLVLAGSLTNFSGFAYLLWIQPKGEYASQIRMILPVACFGMLLDFAAGLLPLLPEPYVLDYLGTDDGVRLRMMRLARVAAIALSVLTLLYYGVASRAGMARRAARIGGLALAAGAIGMPAILAASCFTSLYFKYLLTLPATAVLIGVFLGLHFARRNADPLEWWGWMLIASSTSVGMLLGLYAFDGPFSTPEFLGEYNALPRRLSRLAHSNCVVLGIMAILLSRELELRRRTAWTSSVGTPLFIAGSAITVVVLVVQIATPIPTFAYCIGPVTVVLGSLLGLASCVPPASRVPH